MPLPSGGRPDEVVGVELGLAEEDAGALLLERDDRPEDHAEARRRDAAEVLEHRLAVVRAQELERRPQVREVEQRQVLVVAVAEDERQDRGLGVVEVEDLAQQQRPERRDARPDVRALLARQRQDLDRVALGLEGELDATRRGWRRPGWPGRRARRRPDRSPLTSTANTGTPERADSWPARSWRVFVLPVPVAPAISPWRLMRDSGTWTRTSGRTSSPGIGEPEHDDRLVERVAGGHLRRGTRRPPSPPAARRRASWVPMIAPARVGREPGQSSAARRDTCRGCGRSRSRARARRAPRRRRARPGRRRGRPRTGTPSASRAPSTAGTRAATG